MADISGLRGGQNHAPTATLATVSPTYSGRVTAGFRFTHFVLLELIFNHPLSSTFSGARSLLILEPKVFGDARGFFFESFNQQDFNQVTGLEINFVQDNHSRSTQGVLRGLHYQVQQPQGKLVRVVRGAVFDVAVDIRQSSPTFGQWAGVELTEDNHKQVWVPPGFAHGFVVLTDTADFLYKTTDYYAPAHERCIVWDDPAIGINWPPGLQPKLSAKDQAAQPLAEAELF
jgi:dTDP-4-dehydrorhamnose 3,5-epimerase